MYETLLTNEECAKAIDLGGFYRVPADNRGLNYDKFFRDGDADRNTLTEFNSNNTKLLNKEEIKEKCSNLHISRRDWLRIDMSKKLVILGAGGYANTVKDVSEQLGYDVIAMLDDRFADRTLDSFTKYIADDTEFIPAFGNNEFRLSWCDKITRADGRLATVVHPTAYVSPTASIERALWCFRKLLSIQM